MQHDPLSKSQLQHRQKIADELCHYLADTYALYLKTQNFHWNVSGPLFYSLHKMFEEQYTELAASVDEIAERIRSLGCYTPASFGQFSQLMSLKDEKSLLSAEAMVQKLIKDHEILVQASLHLIATAQKAHDEGTADLVIQRLKSHEKTIWMLKSTYSK
jgi:starvation-inducible DNA-binding protein